MFYRAALCRVCRQQKQVQLVHARLQDRVLDSILDSIHKVSLSWSMCYARLVLDSITSGVLFVMSTAEVHHISHWFRWLDWDIQVSKRSLTQMQKSNTSASDTDWAVFQLHGWSSPPCPWPQSPVTCSSRRAKTWKPECISAGLSAATYL
jgi:hypothetical protein